jgi:hypothetical protein
MTMRQLLFTLDFHSSEKFWNGAKYFCATPFGMVILSSRGIFSRYCVA